MSRAEFDPLYREHYHRILGLCRRMLGSVHDAEDAAQEVFMRGYRSFRRYRPQEPFGPWIGAIATNYGQPGGDGVTAPRKRTRHTARADVFATLTLPRAPGAVHGRPAVFAGYRPRCTPAQR